MSKIVKASGICTVLISLCAAGMLPASGKDNIMKSKDCITSYIIDRGTNPWHGFTSNYEEESAAKTIAAVPLKGSAYRQIPSLEKYTRSGIYPIGRSDALRKVAVEASLFSDLKKADATRNSNGRFEIGTFKNASFTVMKPAELAAFLIESQIVTTYWHVEADFCLVEEANTAVEYVAHYRGKHIYFTNKKNEDALDFRIIINKQNGRMFIDAQ